MTDTEAALQKQVMNRNSTNFAISLYEKLKSYKFDSDYRYLFYYQYIVTKYINDIDIKSRGLLVYHTMGMGKSILAVAIAMSLRNDYEPIVLLTKSLEANFRDSIVKFLKMAEKEGEYTQLGNMPEADIRAWIERNFSFVSMNASNMITQITRATEASADVKTKKMEQRLANVVRLGSLDGKVLIVDEAHNLFRAIINGSKNGVELYDMIMRAKDAKIVFLTGTPVSNHPFELVPCFNMLVGTTALPVLPENWDDFGRYFIDSKTNTIKNKEKFQNRIMGLVSHITHTSNPGGAADIKVAKKSVEFPTELPIKVEKVPMENSQYVKYLLARDKELAEIKGFSRFGDTPNLQKPKSEFTSSYRVRTRQISNFAIPDSAKLAKEPEDVPANESSSPKFEAMRKNIEEGVGLDLVYSQFIGIGGLKMFARYLEHNGYKEISVGTKKSKKVEKADEDQPLPADSLQAREEISDLQHRATVEETPQGLVVKGSYESGESVDTNNWYEGGDESGDEDNATPNSGKIILAPCGTGKSHWIRENPDSGWVEGDTLYEEANVSTSDFQAADKINKQAKSDGNKIMTSTWYDMDIIDAIVIPDLDKLKEQLKGEERKGNDPERAIQLIRSHHAKSANPPPIYDSIEAAVAAVDGDHTVNGGAAANAVVKPKMKANTVAKSTNVVTKSKTFALIMGDVDPDDRNKILQMFNDDNNKHGENISILLISSTGAEGLDGKNIRRVHIMEPYWSHSRHAQVISRAVRNDSHIALPQDEKNVQPYIYLSVAPTGETLPDSVASIPQTGPTTDEELYEKSLANHTLITQFTQAVKEVSIECMLNGESYCRVCSPTDIPLFSNNILLDIKSADPCVAAVEKTVKAEEIIINDDKYYYKPANDSVFGYNVFVHDKELNTFRKMNEDNPLFQKIVKEIKKHVKGSKKGNKKR